jgi:hypothetical protein
MMRAYVKMSTKTERRTTAVQNPTDDLNLKANGRLGKVAGASLDISAREERYFRQRNQTEIC